MRELEQFFEQSIIQFQNACDQAGHLDRQISIAGSPIQLRFAGETMMTKLFLALAHLEVAPTLTPDLAILVWDSASVGGMISPPPWDALPYVERAQIRRYQDDRFFLAYDRNTSVFMGFDRLQAVALYWTRDSEWIPYFETAAPMRHLLQAWLNPRGLYLCHGGAVGLESGAVMLSGRGGAGKSTTSLLSLQEGFYFLGDDFILLSDVHGPTVHALYSSAKLNIDSVAWLPVMQPLISNLQEVGPWEKALLFLHPTHQDKLIEQLPLKAIVMPHPSNDAMPSLELIRGMDAYRILAPDTIFRGQGDATGVLTLYRRLVDQLPVFRLNLGSTPSAVPQALQNWLSRELA